MGDKEDDEIDKIMKSKIQVKKSKQPNTLSKHRNILSKQPNTLSKQRKILSKQPNMLSKKQKVVSKQTHGLSKQPNKLSKPKVLSKQPKGLSKQPKENKTGQTKRPHGNQKELKTVRPQKLLFDSPPQQKVKPQSKIMPQSKKPILKQTKAKDNQ